LSHVLCALLLLAPLAPPTEPAPDAASLRRADDALVGMGLYLEERAALIRQADRRAVAELDARTADSPLPLVGARARFEQARATARAGGLRYAHQAFVELGLLDAGWVIGPFEHTGAANIDAPTPPEVQGLAAGLAAGAVDGQPWQQVVMTPRDGELDLGAHLPRQREVSALLVGVAIADAALPAALRVSTSTQVHAEVNGRHVLRRDVLRPLGWDQDSVGVRLQKGPNLVVLRLGNLEGPLRARVRLTAPDGAPLGGVRWSLLPEDLDVALTTAPAQGQAPPVASLEQAIDALLAAPPLHKPVPPGQPDRLRAAIAVEADRRRRDQRQTPKAHDLWRLGLLLRLRTSELSPAHADALAETLVALGDALADDDPTAARQRYESALEVAPERPAALLGLARLRAAQDLEAETVALLRRTLAASALTDDDRAEAWDGLRLRGWRTLEIDRALLERAAVSEHTTIVQLAADVAEQRGDLPMAWTLADRLLAWDEADAVGHRLALGRLRAQLAHDPADLETLEALADRMEIMALHRPHAHRAVRELVLTLEGAGQRLRVDQLLADRRARYPALAVGWALTAEVATWRGDRPTAREALRQALVRTPQDRDLRTMLRTLEPDSDDLARRYGLSPEDAEGVPVPDGAVDVGAHVVHRQLAARFFDNGLGTLVEDRLVRIHDKDKAAGFAELGFPYADGREVVEVLRAFRVRPDGRRLPGEVLERAPQGKIDGVYTDERTVVIDFGQVEAGDLLWIRVRKDLVGKENLFGAFFGLLEPLQFAVPVARFSMIVEVPQRRPLAFGGRGAPAPVIEERGDLRIYRFDKQDIPRIDPEPNMPPYMEIADFVSVSSIDRWEELGDWYEDLIGGALTVDDELTAAARKATMGAKSTAEKVRRLYELVVRETRYVGIELGIHGWRPYPVVEVFRRKYGDCKDKASLLIALLHAVGIEGRIVLVRTADLGEVPSRPPSMWLFNHAIAYVPELDLYLDGTSEFGGWRELPALDQGALGLVVAPYSDAPPAWVRLPLDKASANANVATYDLTLGPDGSVFIQGEERFTGALAAEQRAELADASFRQDALQRSLGEGLPGVRVTSMTPVGETITSSVVGYDFIATVPARARRQDDGTWLLPVSLYPQELARGWARRSTRTWGVWVAHPWRTRNTMRYRLPAGWTLSSLPKGGLVETDALRFEQRVTRTNDGFEVTEETILKQRHITAAQYRAFRQACTRADELMRASVSLTPGGGA
jgi:transglutaminase-like putative cysteine protease